MGARRNYSRTKTKTRKRKKGSTKILRSLIMLGLLISFVVAGIYWARHVLTTRKVEPVKEASLRKPKITHVAEEAPGPKFEFYKVLPSMQVDVEKSQPSKASLARYEIRVLSLKKPGDVDRVRAELLLAGYNAHMSPDPTKDNAMRLVLGPYNGLGQAEEDLEKIRKAHYGGVINRIHVTQ